MKIRVVIPDPRPEDLENALLEYSKLARNNTVISATVLDKDVPRNADPTDPYVMPAILRKIQEAEHDGMDAVIIHCMEDPGVEAGRQLVSIPVIGPAQASFHLACMLGYKFSVLFPLDNDYYVKKLVDRYGLMGRLASVRIMDISLEQLAIDKEASIKSLVKSAIQAVKEDGAHVVVPGCLYAIGLAKTVQDEMVALGYDIPVIDPGLVALRTAEMLVEMKVSFSKRTYPKPLGIMDPYW